MQEFVSSMKLVKCQSQHENPASRSKAITNSLDLDTGLLCDKNLGLAKQTDIVGEQMTASGAGSWGWRD